MAEFSEFCGQYDIVYELDSTPYCRVPTTITSPRFTDSCPLFV